MPATLTLSPLLLMGVLLSAGCTPDEDGGGPSGQRAPDTAAVAGGPAAAGGPTLLALMRGLESDMDRISHALWAERHDELASAARTVADHPLVGPAERERVVSILGDRAAAFQQADVRVHDDALRLADAAAAADMPRILTSLATLQEGCVECHSAFRQELRTTGDTDGAGQR